MKSSGGKLIGVSIVLLGLVCGCRSAGPSNGGGQAAFGGIRRVNPADVWLPPGYHIEMVTQGLNFPTGVTFDDKGQVYVVEAGYSYGEVWAQPRLLRIVARDVADVVARGSNGPWNGVTFHDGNFYLAEGGEAEGGRILRISPDGTIKTLVDNLPSLGDHHTNGPIVGSDGYVYFGQGTATNSGVVGLDDYQYGWLKRHRDFHDIPPHDIVLSGINFRTDNPFAHKPQRAWYECLLPFLGPRTPSAVTGAYLPFGTYSYRGQVIHGQLPCTGAIMRVPESGGDVELVAWGLRNPFGLAFSPDGKLFATENQFDVRGSRPVWGTGDLLWEITPDTWYGWPDYFAGVPINNADRFGAPGAHPPTFLLARHPGRPPHPAAAFGVHASADGLDFCRSREFGHVGDAFVAEFGDMAPQTGSVIAPVGFRVVRVEMEGGIIHPFAVNRGREDAPASKLGRGGLERPIAVRFDPAGDALYVVDFGVMTVDSRGVHPIEFTGVLWRITREGR